MRGGLQLIAFFPEKVEDVARVAFPRVFAEYRSAGRAEDRSQFWDNVQFLRFLAAYAIVLIHAQAIFDAMNAAPAFVESLRVGTDLFLVLAGFFTAHAINRSSEPTLSYIRNRMIRIYPAFALFTILAFISKEFEVGQAHQIGELVSSLMFVPYGPYPILHPTWTLNFIIEFSLLAAITLMLDVRWRMPVLCTLALTLVFFGQIGHVETYPWIEYTNPLLIDLVLGVLIFAIVQLDLTSVMARRPVLIAACLFILAGLTAAILRPFYWIDAPRPLALGIPAAGILFGTLLLEKQGVRLRLTFINFMAKCSYSIYLCHQFVIGVSIRLIAAHPLSGAALAFLLAATLFVVTVGSILVYVYVEAPLARYLLNATASRK